VGEQRDGARDHGGGGEALDDPAVTSSSSVGASAQPTDAIVNSVSPHR
jgi:hypothetical protein